MAKAETKSTATTTTTTTIKVEALQGNRLLHLREDGKNLKRVGFKLGQQRDIDPNLIKHYLVTDDKGNFVKKSGKHQFKANWFEQFREV